MDNLENFYRDIIHYSYPNPEIEKDFPDPVLRGAQFAPFAALTGHDEAIEETARLTDGKIILSETRQEEINRSLQFLLEHIGEHPMVLVTYFVADQKKQGGAYDTKQETVLKIRAAEQILLLSDKTEISFSDILNLGILA